MLPCSTDGCNACAGRRLGNGRVENQKPEGGGGVLTFSSVLSRSFLRKDSTQSLKHFSTSELYIRRLHSNALVSHQNEHTPLVVGLTSRH